MRDRWALTERMFAAYYPRLAVRSERAGQAQTRAELLSQAHGRTLEIGAGNGFNLPHYPPAVTELVLTDPSPYMLELLSSAVAGRPDTYVLEAGIETLPFDDASFDTVVCTFVLCSVPSLTGALSEIARVLAPGGIYLFLEHVRAGEGTMLGRVQDLLEVPHRIAAAGCYPNRRTEQALTRSPLHVVSLHRGRQPSSLPTVRPTIMGSAQRPA